jgi:hypothetical protein
VNSLQENLEGQQAASEEVRSEFKALVEQRRAALEDRTKEIRRWNRPMVC